MSYLTKQESRLALLEAVRKSVAELEYRMNYTAKSLPDCEKDRLDTEFHYAMQMGRFVEPSEP